MAGAMTLAGMDSNIRLKKRGPKARLNSARQPPRALSETVSSTPHPAPTSRWLKCYECERQSTHECGRCKRRFCREHLRFHGWCCVPPGPEENPCGGGHLAARTVPELKQLCKDAGLPFMGKKLDPLQRLSEAKPNDATVDASPVEKLADNDNWCEAHWYWGHSHH